MQSNPCRGKLRLLRELLPCLTSGATFGKRNHAESKARPLQKLGEQVHGKHDADSIERSEYQIAHDRLPCGRGPSARNCSAAPICTWIGRWEDSRFELRFNTGNTEILDWPGAQRSTHERRAGSNIEGSGELFGSLVELFVWGFSGLPAEDEGLSGISTGENAAV